MNWMNNPVRISLKLSSNICLNGCLFVAQMAVENRNIRRLHVQKRSAMVTFRRKLTGGRRARRTEGSRTEQTEALLCICSLTSHASLVATHRSTASSSSTPQSNQGWFWFPAAPIELQENHVRHTYLGSSCTRIACCYSVLHPERLRLAPSATSDIRELYMYVVLNKIYLK